MKNILMSIYARFRMGLLLGTVYKTCLVYDELLKRCIVSGIYSIEKLDDFYLKATFKDGNILVFWNRNKYYGWMSRGYFKLLNGKKVSFDGEMPKILTMYNFLYEIQKTSFSDKTSVKRRVDELMYLP